MNERLEAHLARYSNSVNSEPSHTLMYMKRAYREAYLKGHTDGREAQPKVNQAPNPTPPDTITAAWFICDDVQGCGLYTQSPTEAMDHIVETSHSISSTLIPKSRTPEPQITNVPEPLTTDHLHPYFKSAEQLRIQSYDEESKNRPRAATLSMLRAIYAKIG
jgi:hypothetical protein